VFDAFPLELCCSTAGGTDETPVRASLTADDCGLRRAAAAVLVQDGVPQTNLVVTGRGENDLRVPTPDGVREPQNRRVEIVEGGPPPTSMR